MKKSTVFERRLSAILETIEREEDLNARRAMILAAISEIALAAPSPFETIGLLECIKDKMLFDASCVAEREGSE